MTRIDRMVVVLWVVLVLGLLAIGMTAFMLMSSTPAAAASICERHNMRKVFTRGGRSWRCKRVRAHRVRRPMDEKKSFRPGEHSVSVRLEPEVRTVRPILIINGRTVHERIDRAFDKLIMFPVEDEP